MLLKCCLLHIVIILARHVIMSRSRSNYVVFISAFHYHFHLINHIISLKLTHLVFRTFLSKVLPKVHKLSFYLLLYFCQFVSTWFCLSKKCLYVEFQSVLVCSNPADKDLRKYEQILL